jgi:hypothetical protein
MPSHVRVCQDARRITGIPGHGDGPVVAGQQRPGMDQHDRVVVEVDHPRVRLDALGDLVDVPGSGKTRAHIQELADPGPGQVRDHTGQERPIPARAGDHPRGQFRDLVGDLPVGGEAVFPAEPVIIDPGGVRPARVVLLQPRLGHRHAITGRRITVHRAGTGLSARIHAHQTPSPPATASEQLNGPSARGGLAAQGWRAGRTAGIKERPAPSVLPVGETTSGPRPRTGPEPTAAGLMDGPVVAVSQEDARFTIWPLASRCRSRTRAVQRSGCL